MATSTELYINAELPKRIYTDQFPLTVGHVPVATGNGLEIVARQLDVADVANAASQQDITDAIDALIDNAPAALDTLNELAAALGDDANYASTVATALGNRLRVDINTQGLTATEQQNGMDNLGVSEVITGASIDGSGVITFTKNGVAADDTVQVPTAVDGLSFNASTGVMTLSYTNGATDTTITVASNEIADNVFRVKDNVDGTKKIAFEASGIATATTRTITMPDRSVDLGDVGAIPDHVNGTVYTAGQVVNYFGQVFRCWSNHTSNTSAPNYDKFAPVSGILIIDNASGSAIVAPANPWIMEMVIISAVDFTINGNNAAIYTYPIRIVCAATSTTKYITITSSTTLSEEGSGEATIYLEKGEEAIIIDGVSWSKGKTNIKDFNTDKRYSKNDIILRDGTLLRVSSAHVSDAVNFYPTTYNATTPLTIPGCKFSKDYLSQQYPWEANSVNASATNSIVLFGYGNKVLNTGANKAVLSGTSNTIGYQTTSGSIISGSGSVLCGGSGNFIKLDTANENPSCLVGGSSNEVTGAGSFLGGGSGNIGSGNYAVLCGGQGNTTRYNGGFTNDRAGSYLTIVNGNNNRIERLSGGKPNYGTILNGNTNYIGNIIDYGLVVNGSSNSVTSGDYATIINGTGNSSTGVRSSIINGSSNIASGQDSYVLGGTQNTASGNYSFASGADNIAANMLSSVYGNHNTIPAGSGGIQAASRYTTIVNGYYNTIIGTTVGTADYSTILNGSYNSITGKNSVILNGSGVVINKNNVTVLSGSGVPAAGLQTNDTLIHTGLGNSWGQKAGATIERSASAYSGTAIGAGPYSFEAEFAVADSVPGLTISNQHRIPAISPANNRYFSAAIHTIDFFIHTFGPGGFGGYAIGTRRIIVARDGGGPTVNIQIQSVGTDITTFVHPYSITVDLTPGTSADKYLIITAGVTGTLAVSSIEGKLTMRSSLTELGYY